MKNIFVKLLYQIEKKNDCVLVTIVEKSGSAPRNLYSQMLINDKHRIIGSIGGGALELKAETLAPKAILSNKSFIQKFDLYNSQSDSDIGMMCGGTVTLHFQYIDHSNPYFIDLAKTIISKTTDLGSNFLNLSKNNCLPTISHEALPEAYFSIPIPHNERAIIFGGGHICLALLPLLNSIDFRVTIMDNRKEYANKNRFPLAEKVIYGDYSNISNYVDFSNEDYVIIMTNGHKYDLEVQKQVLKYNLAYVGVIGSKSKIAFTQSKLLEFGISPHAIDSIHTPIGIDIGAVTPEEIAISIAGEIISCRHKNQNQI